METKMKKHCKNLRNRTDEHESEWTSKPNYISQKIFDNNLVTIRKNKVKLILNNAEYVGMCILVLWKVLMYEFCYDCMKNKMH